MEKFAVRPFISILAGHQGQALDWLSSSTSAAQSSYCPPDGQVPIVRWIYYLPENLPGHAVTSLSTGLAGNTVKNLSRLWWVGSAFENLMLGCAVYSMLHQTPLMRLPVNSYKRLQRTNESERSARAIRQSLRLATAWLIPAKLQMPSKRCPLWVL